jgi:hypothetical protein
MFVFLFYMFCFLFCEFCVFVFFVCCFSPCVIVYFLSVYSFIDHCHQAKTQLQLISIISYPNNETDLKSEKRLRGVDISRSG